MAKLGTYQKKLLSEMREYAKLKGMGDDYMPEEFTERFPEAESKKVVKEHTIPLMMSDYRHDMEVERKRKSQKRCSCKRK